MGLERKYERRGVGELVQGGANLYSPAGCCAMAFLTYDVRLGDLKLYPLEALKVGVGAPVAKPRTALGAAHAAADTVLHYNKCNSRQNETWPWPNPLNARRILYTTCAHQYLNFEPDWTLKPYRICTITLKPFKLLSKSQRNVIEPCSGSANAQ
jgi:hypothetical protein